MNAKYDQIGIDYNLTRKADPYLASRLYHHLNPVEGGKYLDIGCGTGNYTAELYKQGIDLIGIDPSEEMLSKARLNHSQLDFRKGTAEQTGLQDASIDGIIASLTIHHWEDLTESMIELNRVLKGKGRFVLFTSVPEQTKAYWLHHYFPTMISASCSQLPSLEKITQALSDSGFILKETEKYFVKPDLQDLFLYSGKYEPERYFNVQLRKGISSFSSLANQDEVEEGLNELRADIDNGKIVQVMKSYENDLGDYLYIIAERIN